MRKPGSLCADLPAGKVRIRTDALRMRVESTFQDTKTRGWNIEAAQLKERAHLERLLLALFLAVWWVGHLAASCIHHGQRDRFDRHDRRDKGIFRLGRLWLLDILRRARHPAALSHGLPFRKKEQQWTFALRFSSTFLLSQKCRGERWALRGRFFEEGQQACRGGRAHIHEARRAATRANTSHLRTKGGKTRQESSNLAYCQKAKNQGAFDVQITRNGSR